MSPADASVTAPDVELTAQGEIVVAWTQAVGESTVPPVGTNAIRVAVRGRDGDWDRRAVGRTPHFIDAGLRLAVDARGDAAVVWSGSLTRRGSDRLLVAMRLAGHRFRPGQSLGEAGADQRVALDDRGKPPIITPVFAPGRPSSIRSRPRARPGRTADALASRRRRPCRRRRPDAPGQAAALALMVTGS